MFPTPMYIILTLNFFSLYCYSIFSDRGPYPGASLHRADDGVRAARHDDSRVRHYRRRGAGRLYTVRGELVLIELGDKSKGI